MTLDADGPRRVFTWRRADGVVKSGKDFMSQVRSGRVATKILNIIHTVLTLIPRPRSREIWDRFEQLLSSADDQDCAHQRSDPTSNPGKPSLCSAKCDLIALFNFPNTANNAKPTAK